MRLVLCQYLYLTLPLRNVLEENLFQIPSSLIAEGVWKMSGLGTGKDWVLAVSNPIVYIKFLKETWLCTETMPLAYRISWPLMPGLVSRLLAPAEKLAASKMGRGVNAIGQRVLRRVSALLSKSIYMEKNGLLTAVGYVPRQAQLFVLKTRSGLSLCLPQPHDGPASPLCPSKMGQGQRRRQNLKLSLFL